MPHSSCNISRASGLSGKGSILTSIDVLAHRTHFIKISVFDEVIYFAPMGEHRLSRCAGAKTGSDTYIADDVRSVVKREIRELRS
jgi:hypothetical protein